MKKFKLPNNIWLWGGAAIVAAAGAWYFLGPGREPATEAEPGSEVTSNPNPPLMGYDEYRIRQQQYSNRNARGKRYGRGRPIAGHGYKRINSRNDPMFRHDFGRLKNYYRNIS